MAFAEEWVDKKNKTPTTAGDKLNADDLNLLARGIFEALAQGGSDEITRLSQLINDVGFITKDDVPEKLSEFTNDTDFVTKQYIDSLVGEIDAALENIIAIQDGYIYGTMSLRKGGEE